jgi:hypothetical protein
MVLKFSPARHANSRLELSRVGKKQGKKKPGMTRRVDSATRSKT